MSVLTSVFSLAGLPRTFAIYGTAVVAVVARRIAVKLAQYLAIAILMVIGMAFMTTAAFLALTHELGAVYASLIVGGAYLVVGLATLIVTRAKS